MSSLKFYLQNLFGFIIVLVAKDNHMLHKQLRQKSVSGLKNIIDGTADIELWEKENPYMVFSYYKLWT
jgi:hypothetical protein